MPKILGVRHLHAVRALEKASVRVLTIPKPNPVNHNLAFGSTTNTSLSWHAALPAHDAHFGAKSSRQTRKYLFTRKRARETFLRLTDGPITP